MVDLITFRCPTCEANLQATGHDANKSILCSGCGTKVKVPVFFQEPSSMDTETPDAPVVFAKPQAPVEIKPAPMSQGMKIGIGAACAIVAVGIALFAMSGGGSAANTTAKAEQSQSAPAPTTTTTVSQPSAATVAPVVPVAAPMTPKPTPVVTPAAAPAPKPVVAAAPIDPAKAELDALRKEAERLQTELRMKKEKERLEQEINRLKNPTAAQPTTTTVAAALTAVPAVPAGPSGDELKAQIKRTNGEWVVAQRAFLAAQDERATLKNLIKIETDKIERMNQASARQASTTTTQYVQRTSTNGVPYSVPVTTVVADSSDDLQRMAKRQETIMKSQTRLYELEATLPTLEQTAKDLAAKLKSLKDLAKAEAAAKATDDKTEPAAKTDGIIIQPVKP